MKDAYIHAVCNSYEGLNDTSPSIICDRMNSPCVCDMHSCKGYRSKTLFLDAYKHDKRDC